MKVMVTGLGSMGKRRVRNLRALGVKQVIGTDIREDRRREAADLYGITIADNFDAGMEMNPDAVVISTPPNLHLEYARQAAREGKHVFSECSWTEDLNELDELNSLCIKQGVTGASSCTERFQDSVITVRKLVEDGAIGQVIHMAYHSGQWAPDWHPWEDVTEFYLSKKDMGGGREQVSFELNWIMWIMGRVTGVAGLARKLTTLPMDIFDLYQLTAEFESGAVGNITVDMIQRFPNRRCGIMSEQGQIEWDYINGMVRVYDGNTKKWKEYRESPGVSGYLSEGVSDDEPMYLREIQAYLDSIAGKSPFPFSFADEREILAVVHAAEHSSINRRYQAISHGK